MFQVRLVGNPLNDFQVKLTMGHLCNIFQVGKVKAEQLKRADGSVEVWSRWQRRLVQAPARGLHSVQSTLMFSAVVQLIVNKTVQRCLNFHIICSEYCRSVEQSSGNSDFAELGR